MTTIDINFWINQLYIEMKEQNKMMGAMFNTK